MQTNIKYNIQTTLERLKSDRRLLFAVILAAIIVVYVLSLLASEKEAIYLAVVGPMSEHNGQAMVKGVSLVIDEINNRLGGINGKPVKVLVFDDQGDREIARRKAQEIARNTNVLAVLGHYYSSTCIAAGEIYQVFGVPAVTGSATADAVTEGNEWFFRVKFSSRSQAPFIAHYVKKIMNEDTVSIIYSPDELGTGLKEAFEQTFAAIGGQIKYVWAFDREAEDPDKEVAEIVEALSQKTDPGMLLLATLENDSAKFVIDMKRRGLTHPIIGDDSTIHLKLASQPEEIEYPGYFSDGIYATAAIIFDVATDEAGEFKEQYTQKYGNEPGVTAAMYSDAARVIVEAMVNTEVQGDPGRLAEERGMIRDYLASVKSLKNSIEGISGPIYFNEHGTAVKPVTIGVFKHQTFISALTQLQSVTDPNLMAVLEKEGETKDTIVVNDQYLHKTNVAYTGIEIKKICDLDIKDASYTLDFYLWFRHRSDVDADNIEFINAVDPISLEIPSKDDDAGVSRPGYLGRQDLTIQVETSKEDDTAKGTLVEERIENGIIYRRYRVKGTFKADFLPDSYKFDQHFLGVSFHHKTLSRNNLIYVVDVLGMRKTTGETFAVRMKEAQVLSPGSGWAISDDEIFQATAKEISMGNPVYLDLRGGTVEYSQFNAGVWIKRTAYTPRKIIFAIGQLFSYETIQSLFWISAIVTFGLIVAETLKTVKPFIRLLLLFQAFFAVLLLMTVERLLIYWMIMINLEVSVQKIIMQIFDIFWWVIPAFLLCVAIERFIWSVLEQRSGRLIPRIARRFVAFIVYLLAFFGIVAFVYDQKLTGLLATSGVVAMIIGLAIQMNISNIFSGMALNIEQPFRIGDWVKIGDFPEGKIVDMSWRSTKIMTRNYSMLNIPNSSAAGHTIENFNYPDKRFRLIIHIEMVPIYRYERVEKILLDAVSSTEGVLKDPKPKVIFHGQGDSCAIFEVVFYIADYSKKMILWQATWRRIWRHLERADIQLATPQRQILMIQPEEVDVTTSQYILRNGDLLQSVPDDVILSLSPKVKRHRFKSGETIITRGESTDSLFVIAEGSAGVWFRFEDGTEVEISRLGSGNCFGAMALLTDDARKTSISASTATELVEIGKDDITPILEVHPEIIEQLNERLSRREEIIETHKELYQAQKTEKNTLFRKIAKLFRYK